MERVADMCHSGVQMRQPLPDECPACSVSSCVSVSASLRLDWDLLLGGSRRGLMSRHSPIMGPLREM